MNPKLFCLIGIVTLLSGCSSDSSNHSCNPDSTDCSLDCANDEEILHGVCTKICNSDTYNNSCEDNTRIYCLDGFVTKNNCADNELCTDGECILKPGETETCPDGEKLYHGVCTKTCNSVTYNNSCEDNTRVYCLDGFVTKNICAGNEHCTDGECKLNAEQVENCPDGEELYHGVCTNTCDLTSYNSSCEDNARIYCLDGFVTKTICADNEICNAGACVAKIVIKAKCGNGIVENLQTGDACTGEDKSLCESCDDGNLERLDGCSDNCTVETGWDCGDGSSCQFLDENGTPITEDRFSDLIVVDVKVVDGKVVDVGPNQIEQTNWTVVDDLFEAGKLSIPQKLTAGTLFMLVDYDRSSKNALLDWRQYDYYETPVYGLQELVKDSIQGAGIVTIPGWYPPGGVANLHAQISKDTPVLNNGIAFWAAYGDVDAPIYGIRVNGRHADTDRNDFKIDKVTNYYPDHKYKEIVVYNRVLTQRELDFLYAKADIKVVPDDTPLIGRILDGMSELGPALAFTRTPNGYPKWYDEAQKIPGTYSTDDGNGLTLNYEIRDFVAPVNASEKSYESVHIIKKPKTIPLGYKYALSAFPYPFDVHGDDDESADPYDVTWSSSDPSVAVILDGIVIPKKVGKVTMTATLAGTNITDSCTIEIVERKLPADKSWNVPKDYKSAANDMFSASNYEMTTRAIYAAIDEAFENGYNHVVFPKIDFHAAPVKDEKGKAYGYQVPQGMTVEFPKGSVFYMEDSEIAKTDGYVYFKIGYGWSDSTLPVDEENQILYQPKSDVHIIIDEYHGEMFNNKAHKVEDYAWGNQIASMTRYAEFSTVEVHYADYTTGMFITVGGQYNPGNNQPSGAGSTLYTDYEKGWIGDDGLNADKSHWIRTKDYVTVPTGYGKHALDKFSEYYIGPFAGRPALSQGHLYDIVWYDKDKKFIQVNRWQYISEFYDNRPENAAYFRLAIQKDDLPTENSDYQGVIQYVAMHEGSPARYCEVRNSTAVHTGDGLVSCVGLMDACWIHHNYVTKGETKDSDWAIDLEDGFLGMRRTIVENNIVPAPLYLSGGFNNVVISNYIEYLDVFNYSDELNRVLNNTCYILTMTEKINAHIYNNIYTELKVNPKYTSNGSVFVSGNIEEKYANYY